MVAPGQRAAAPLNSAKNLLKNSSIVGFIAVLILKGEMGSAFVTLYSDSRRIGRPICTR